MIKSIHRQYLDAGADIFATNTFNANAISMEDYGMQGQVRNINLAAGKLAREVADGFMKEHPDRTIFVAGSVGPTNKTASMSPDVSDPAYRAVTYLDLYSAYKEQVDALVDGGVDIVLFETTFDTLNVKAGLEAAEAVLKEKGKDLPIMLSLTLSAQGGRTFSGQTLLAFLASVQPVSYTHLPRHTVFHPNGKWAYLISELSGRVALMYYDKGNLTPVRFVEADTLHVSGSADIHITPDGRFLYASNRLKGDGIAIFSIDLENGQLTKIGYQLTGIHPRNFVITPNGKFLLCACRDSHIVQVYEIDKQSGLLKDTGKDIRVSKPVCLKFTDM